MEQHDKDHAGSFTQVRATVRRKTLLLLWCIDGGKMVVCTIRFARQGCLGAKMATRVLVCEGVDSLTLSMVALGLLL